MHFSSENNLLEIINRFDRLLHLFVMSLGIFYFVTDTFV